MSDHLLTTLRKLRLSGLAESLEIRLHEAATSGLYPNRDSNSRVRFDNLACSISGPYCRCMSFVAVTVSIARFNPPGAIVPKMAPNPRPGGGDVGDVDVGAGDA